MAGSRQRYFFDTVYNTNGSGQLDEQYYVKQGRGKIVGIYIEANVNGGLNFKVYSNGDLILNLPWSFLNKDLQITNVLQPFDVIIEEGSVINYGWSDASVGPSSSCTIIFKYDLNA